MTDDYHRDLPAARKRPIGERARRSKLSKLREYGLIEAEGDAHEMRYRSIDPDLASPLPIEELVT